MIEKETKDLQDKIKILEERIILLTKDSEDKDKIILDKDTTINKYIKEKQELRDSIMSNEKKENDVTNTEVTFDAPSLDELYFGRKDAIENSGRE